MRFEEIIISSLIVAIITFLILVIVLQTVEIFTLHRISKSLNKSQKNQLKTINLKYLNYFTYIRFLLLIYVVISRFIPYNNGGAIIAIHGLVGLIFTSVFIIFFQRKVSELATEGLPKNYIDTYQNNFLAKNIPLALMLTIIAGLLITLMQN